MKTVYTYDPETKEYQGTVEAQINPMDMEEGSYLMPAFTTEEQPPEAGENQTVVYDGQWVVKPDYRTQTIWKDYETFQEVIEIGEIPDGWSLQRPEKPLEMLKEEAIAQLKSLKSAVNNYGVTEPITLSDGNKYKADINLDAISNIQVLVMAHQSGMVSEATNYTFADNQTIEITAEDCMNIGASMMAIKNMAHHKVLNAKQAVTQAGDAQTIETILAQTQDTLKAYISA